MPATRRAMLRASLATPAFAALPAVASTAAATPQDPMIDALAEMTRRLMPGDKAAALAVLRGNPGSEPRDPAVAAYWRWRALWERDVCDERDGIDAVNDAVDARFDAFHDLATTTPTTIEGVRLQLAAHATVMGDAAQINDAADARLIETARDALAGLGATS